MPPHDADALTTPFVLSKIHSLWKLPMEAEKASGLIEVIGEAVDAEYLKKLKT